MVLQAGVRLGPYEIVGPLGAGGMGEVYKARDTRLDRIVAVKVLPASLAADPVFRDRFDREARRISSLDHAHICVLYDVGREAGVDYLVMQFLDGETLAHRLQRGPLPTFPSGTGIWQVSTGGGKSPVWSRDGKQLYYLTARDLVSSAVSTSAGFSAGPPRAIMPRTLAAPDNAIQFDFAQVTPDGRVLAAVRRATGAGAPYRLVLNWNR
jgi:serine/threonine protein kinase